MRVKLLELRLRGLLEGEETKRWVGLYFRLSSLSELPDGQHYRLKVKVPMDDGAYYSPKINEAATEVLGDIESLIASCHGIDLEEAELLPESEFSLLDVREYQRFTVDYLSYGEDDSVDPVVDG